MGKKQGAGRPRKPDSESKKEYLEVRVDAAEKAAFQQAAGLAGLPLSAWVRTRLREFAAVELQHRGIPVPFFPRQEE